MRTLGNFVQSLERCGLLRRIVDRVDWRYEIGDMTRSKTGSATENVALLFENVTDYPGWSILTNGLGTLSRIALAVGLEPSASFRKLVEFFRDSLPHPIDPKVVHDAEVNIDLCRGNKVDLCLLPVPWWNREDAGRYLGTWHVNVSNSSEDGTRNVGVYRMQILSANEASLSVSPHSHLSGHIRAARRLGLDLQMAVAIGVPEPVVIAAASALPYGIDEYGFAGALMGQPLEIARCATVEVDVPATSEIVLEGTVDPNDRVLDGPFLDYAGVPNANPTAYRYRVQRIAVKEGAMFRGATIGLPGAEDHLISAVLARVGLLDFHGSRLRNRVQSFLIANRMFGAFQLSGRFSQFLGRRR